MAILFQILAASIISFICMTLGVMYTWPSSTFTLFISPNTTLNRVMTENEISLLASISSISAIIVIPFSGYLLDTLGRKRSCFLFYMAQVASWVLIVASNTVEAVLIAMFISGLNGSILLVVPIYVSELCQESIRGSITSLSIVFYGIGMLISYILGGCLEYKMMNYVCLIMTIIGVILLTLMKDSPVFLVKSGQEKEAAQAIAFFKGLKENSKEVDEEIQTIRNLLNEKPNASEFIEEEEEEEKIGLKVEEAPSKRISSWEYLKTSKSTQRALMISVVLYTATLLQGLTIVLVFAKPLFDEAVPGISSTLSSVILALVSVIAAFVGAYCVDWFGRRPLMIYGSIATGISCIVLGSQIQFHWGPHWFTIVLINVYCVAYTVGAGTVPYVIAAEVFMPEVKGLASMITAECAFLVGFFELYIYNPVLNAIGLGPVFYIFAGFCIVTAVFSFHFLPETKGLPVNVIQRILLQKGK